MDKVLATCIFGAFATLMVSAQIWTPIPRNEQSWIDRHNQFVRTSELNGHNINIVFIGSSSIERWSTTGASLWNAKYAPLGAVNYGIGGDRIENCLWRALNGELENISPALLVLYCGSNNIRHPNTTEVSFAVSTTINEIKSRLPNTTVLYVNFFPRSDVTPATDTFDRIVRINSDVSMTHDGDENTLIFDMFENLIGSNWGELNATNYAGDNLHLNPTGYVLWDNLWNSTFYQGLNGNRK